MKLTRRETPDIGMSFLDTITCGIGAIILLMVITTTTPLAPATPTTDPREAEISQLQRTLFASRDEVTAAIARLDARRAELAAKKQVLSQLTTTTAATVAQQTHNSSADQEAALNAKIYGELEVANQRLTEEMQRLYAQRQRPKVQNFVG